jgi:iron(III) transport system ATP-binding protein
MDLGNVMQADTPETLYNKPSSKFVYGFLGLSNFLETELRGGTLFARGEKELPLPVAPEAGTGADTGQKEGILASRPNEITISGKDNGGYPAVVVKRLYLTFCIEYQLRIGDQTIRVHTSHANVFKEGQHCYIGFKNPRWYPRESAALELERTARQVV